MYPLDFLSHHVLISSSRIKFTTVLDFYLVRIKMNGVPILARSKSMALLLRVRQLSRRRSPHNLSMATKPNRNPPCGRGNMNAIFNYPARVPESGSIGQLAVRS